MLIAMGVPAPGPQQSEPGTYVCVQASVRVHARLPLSVSRTTLCVLLDAEILV